MSEWVDAFNARELGSVLACVDPDVDLHPLKLAGLDARYRGHDGVRTWFGQLEQLHHEHQISLSFSDFRRGDDGQVLAVGVVAVGELTDLGPFCGVYRVADGLIVAAHHYFTAPAVLERIGVFR